MSCNLSVMLSARPYIYSCLRGYYRQYNVLAIESSCDDSCVALLQKTKTNESRIKIIDHAKRTLDSADRGGIIPTAAHDFHQATLATLVSKFCVKNNISPNNPPSFICCTRGPGMVGSLSAGLQLAKGLAVAWDVPLIGVHHMLGHIVASSITSDYQSVETQKFPLLSFLCSGGHTILVLLKSISQHEILADTVDIAAGDALDKCARELKIRGNMPGKSLEQAVAEMLEATRQKFANVNLKAPHNSFGIKIPQPFRGPNSVRVPDHVNFSFAAYLSTLQRFFLEKNSVEVDGETLALLRFKFQEAIFDHIVDRINTALIKFRTTRLEGITDLVVSGGVAANKILREKLGRDLIVPFNVMFPPIHLCTDNAIMIGVAGIELFELCGVYSDLGITPIRRWPLSELMHTGEYLPMSESAIRRMSK